MASAVQRTPEEEWRAILDGTHEHFQHRSPLRFIPTAPRCKLCLAPFGAPGNLVLRRFGYSPWAKNPKICARCFVNLRRGCPTHEDERIAGATVHISMLFADVRGSSELARRMPVREFTQLMTRFYSTATEVLIGADAAIEKFVGDEVVGLFLPFLTGPGHARGAVDAAVDLLRATGHGTPEGPWCPLGASVHTGEPFVGIIGSSDDTSDFTALGDPMNLAAHLASHAAVGEVLVSLETARESGIDAAGLERRSLSLKGHPFEAVVLSIGPASVEGAVAPP